MSDNNDFSLAVRRGACRALDGSMKKIAHCLDQLDESQIWWRPADGMNSIGNLLLHLAGNLRQWVVAGVGNEHDTRDRPSEFTADGTLTKPQLWQQLQQVVDQAKQTLLTTPDERFTSPCVIQGFEVLGIEAVFDSLPHFQGHAQEIICLTRMQLGEKYQYAWVPSTPAEGA